MRSALIVIGLGLGVAALAIAASEAFAARDIQPEMLFPRFVKLACFPFGVRGVGGMRQPLMCREK